MKIETWRIARICRVLTLALVTVFLTCFAPSRLPQLSASAQTYAQAASGKTPLQSSETKQPPPSHHMMPDQHIGHQRASVGTQQHIVAGRVLTLAEIEQIAMRNNPTLAQAEAAIRAAQGRRRQAGLWPNPIVGYQGEEFAFRAFSQKSEHFFFITTLSKSRFIG